MTARNNKEAIVISSDWEYTRTRATRGTTFAFHSSRDCPGFTLEIDNWQFRKEVSDEYFEPERLAMGAFEELKRVLGESVFSETNRLLKAAHQRAKHPVGILRPDWAEREKEYVENLMLDLSWANIKDILSPRVRVLSIPLFSLVYRHRVPFSIHRLPWSYSTPPRVLKHLATIGFDSHCSDGILALPPDGDYIWRVSYFSQCEVETKRDTDAAFQRLFPWIDTLKTLPEEIVRIREAIDAEPLKTAALLRGTIKQRLGTLGTVVEEDFTASPHFTNLSWRGKQYVLRGTAAIIIETLYIAQKHYAIPGFHQKEVFAQVYGSNKKGWPSSNVRIQNFFRTGDAKRLWNDGLINHDGKGNFSLNIKIHTHTQ